MSQFMCYHIIGQGITVGIPIYHLIAAPERIIVGTRKIWITVMHSRYDRHTSVINAISKELSGIQVISADGIFMGRICVRVTAVCAVGLSLGTKKSAR